MIRNKLSYFPLLVLIACGSDIGPNSSERSTDPFIEVKNDVSGDTLEVDLDRSRIKWKGTKMKGAGKHEGDISLQNGWLITSGDSIVGGSFIVDMGSITVTDIPEHEPVPRKRLTDHLKSSDFFDVKKYPIARFTIAEMGSVAGTDSLRIQGNLTIKGITKGIILTAVRQGKKFIVHFSIDRSQWEVAYTGNWLENTLVDKDIELKVSLWTL